MILIILVLTCLGSSWSGKPLDYTPLLQYLDDDIIRDLTSPIDGRAHILKDNVNKYNERLGHARDMIDQNVFEAYIKAVELQKLGGPQFLKANINRDLLNKVYSWTGDDTNNLLKEFELTKQIWKELEANLKPAAEIFKRIQEQDAKEKAEQAEREQIRIEKLRKTEEEFSKKVTVNLGTSKPE